MRLTSKIVLFALVLCAVILAVRHGGSAMQASLPKDMPENAHFLQSGYDINTNEAKGNWIACRVDAEQGVNWCRVTDAHGMVVFEGNYLPIDSSSPVPESELKIAADSPVQVVGERAGGVLAGAGDSSGQWEAAGAERGSWTAAGALEA